jgi:hypothetical protein
MNNTHLKSLLQKKMTRKDFLSLSAVTVASLFAIVGVITELLSHAATPYASQEAEDGTLTTSASAINDTTASGNKAVQFGTAAAQPITQSLILGMNVGDNSGFSNTPGAAGNAALTDYGAAQFMAMKAAGISTVRIDCSAGYFASPGQPAPVPLKGGIDQEIKAAYNAQLEILLIIDADETMTQDTYIAFVTQLVAYYSQETNGNVHYYEIFNEFNLGGSWLEPGTAPTPAAYCTLLKAAYAAVKAADPTAKVLFSGLAVGNGSPNGVMFMQDSYNAMGGDSTGYFDIINVHVYTIVAASGSGAGTTLPATNSLPSTGNYYWQGGLDPTATTTDASGGPSIRAQMIANGDTDKPIWITEFGAPTGTLDGYTNTTTYNGLALEFLTAFQVLEDNNWNFVERFYAYIWNDSDDDFGLNTYLYQPKSITGNFTGLPAGVTNVVEAFTSGCTYTTKFSGNQYTQNR